MRKSFTALIPFLLASALFDIFGAPLEEKLYHTWRWVSFGVESGLPQSRVKNVVEAEDGVIWALTTKGFAWYNGFTWAMAPVEGCPESNASLLNARTAHNSGLALCENGRLIIAGKHGFSEEKMFFENGEKPYVISAIPYEGSKYILRVRDRKKTSSSLYLYDGILLSKFPAPGNQGLGESNMPGNALFKAKNGAIWLKTPSALYLFKNKEWVKKISFGKREMNIPFFDTEVNGSGYFFISFPADVRGVYKISNGNISKIIKSENYIVKDLIAFKNQALLFYPNGLAIIKENGTIIPLDFPNNIFIHILKSTFTGKGRLWLAATNTLYLCRLEPRRIEYIEFPQPDLKNFVNEIIRLKDSSLALATGGGLAFLKDGKEIEVTDIIEAPLLKGVTALVEDDDGNIWAGSGSMFSGAYRLSGKEWKYFSIDSSVSACVHKIRKDSSGKLWFLCLSGTEIYKGNGVYSYNPERGFFKEKHLKYLDGYRVYDFITANNSQWFATNRGLCRWDGSLWKVWKLPGKTKSNRVFSLAAEPGSSRIWFSANESGIGYIEDDSVSFVSSFEKNGAFNAGKLAFSGDTTLWAAYTEGLASYKGNILTVYNTIFGINVLSASTFLVEKGRILLGTSGGGLNIVDLGEAESPLPKVYLSEPKDKHGAVSISWKAYSWYGQIPPGEIEVQYRLKGGQWASWTKKREAVFEGLNPGEYSFEIRSKGIFGNVSPAVSSMDFFVEAPLHLKPEFYMPIIVLLAILTAFVGKYINNRKTYILNLYKANEELEHREKTLNAILTASPVGISLYSNGVIRWANPAFSKITGFSQKDIINKDLSFLFHSSKEYKEFGKELNLPWAGSSPYMKEATLAGKLGEPIEALLAAHPVDSTGHGGKIIAVMDISERKKHESQQRLFMEAMIDAERRQNSAAKMIEKSMRIASIGVIASGITHEINQPLNVIKVGADGMMLWNEKLGQKIPDNFVGVIKGISEAVRRIDEIIRHMRMYWIDSNKSDLVEVDVREILENSKALLSQRARANGIKLIIQNLNESAYIKANPTQLELMFNNFVSNSIRSLDKKGPGEKWIKIQSYFDENSVYLEFQDNGIGLPNVSETKLFDPFFSLGQETGGTGLGLSIVKMFVDRFDAKIEARANEIGGAAFKITFKKITRD